MVFAATNRRLSVKNPALFRLSQKDLQRRPWRAQNALRGLGWVAAREHSLLVSTYSVKGVLTPTALKEKGTQNGRN